MYTFPQLGFPINKHITLIQELHAHFTYFSSYIRRSPAPSSIGTPTNNHLVATYHQMHDSATLRASPAPSTASMMSSSSRASSTLRSIKNQSPVVMNTAKSMQVQKPVRQAATAPSTATSEMTNTVGPSFAQPLTKRMAVVPECSTPPLTSGATAIAPPPPSYEISLQQKEVNSPITVPRTESPSIQSPQVANDNRPPPPPYHMKPPMYPPTDTTNSSSRSGTPYSESSAMNSENTDSSSPVDFQDRTLTPRDSGYGQSTEAPPLPPPYKTNHHTSPKPERKFPGLSSESKDRKSCIKNCSPDAYKFFMEKHYDQKHGKVWQYYKDRKERLSQFYNEIERHLDPNKFTDIDQFKQKLYTVESEHLRQQRKKMKRNDFIKLKILGRGAFGEVSLVRKNGNANNINHASQILKEPAMFAMKTLLKSHIVKTGKTPNVMAEKDILSEANNPWIVQLYYSFQDKKNVYFILEYIPGGDLMERLIREELFSEEAAKFYTAQLICAVESVHDMGFIHRDIKPDNILIDRKGNLKLTDFGLCTGFRWTHESDKYFVNGGELEYHTNDVLNKTCHHSHSILQKSHISDKTPWLQKQCSILMLVNVHVRE